MRPERYVLRVAVTGIVSVVVCLVVLAGYLGVRFHAYEQARHRATAVVPGVVTADRVGDQDAVRVAWTDAGGRAHEQVFAIYDTEQYRRGEPFQVAYDPVRPDGAFPADPSETSDADDLEVPIFLGGAIAVLLLAGWAWRGWRFRSGRRRPARAMTATVLTGDSAAPGPISPGASAWIALSELEAPAVGAWQRVMWHPALDSALDRLDVQVRGDVDGWRSVVVVLSDGTQLVPVGRLRHKDPGRTVLLPRAETAVHAEELFILPSGAVPPPGVLWWRRAAQYALAAAAVGTATGFLIGGGGDAAVPFAAGLVAVAVNGWAFAGAEP